MRKKKRAAVLCGLALISIGVLAVLVELRTETRRGTADGVQTSGTEGTPEGSGLPGTPGTAGTSGTPGTAGEPGIPGAAGTSEEPGMPGTAGGPGMSGTAGTSGTEGTASAPEEPGTAGTSETEGTAGAPGEPAPDSLAQILTENAVIWSEPGEGEELARLAKGTMVEVLSEDDAWWQVRCGEETGYIESDYLVRTPEFDPEIFARPVIVIDAGHQGKGNSQQEPVGPGASATKAKVAGGTTSVNNGMPESELTLTIALLLEEELEQRGYTVIQVRRSQDVDISNRERSLLANELMADAFLRLHANGAQSAGANGAQTICAARDNPYFDGTLYEDSYRLSSCVLDAYTAETGCKREYISERNDMTGINWCEVPVTILEMGYMTNPSEDLRMQDAAYQQKMVTGIANGVDAYFAGEDGRQE